MSSPVTGSFPVTVASTSPACTCSPADGLIAEVRVAAGEQVQAGDVLVTVTVDGPATEDDTVQA